MAINKNKVQLQETVLDSNGHPLSSTDVNPLTSSDCVIMENGMTLEDVMGNDTVIDTPTIMNEDTSFKVGIGDSETKVIDSDVAKMVIEGKTYQNILPKPTTLIMNTDEKEFKINDKIDNSIVLDDNVAEIATVKGQTYVNVVQEESASEYVAIDEELNGQSITTTGKPEGYVKNAMLEGLTLVNTIQEPSEANSVVLDLDADINAQYATIDNTVQGGIHGAILKGQTLVNLFNVDDSLSVEMSNKRWKYQSRVRNLIAGNTYYVYFFNKLNNSPLHIKPINTEGEKGAFTVEANTGKVVTLDSTIIYASAYYYFKDGWTGEESKQDIIDNCKILFLEYQEGMENWDIPYFEGMQSVEVPSVTTTGKNLFSPTKIIIGDGALYGYYKYKDDENVRYTLSVSDKDTSVDISNIYFGISKKGKNPDIGFTWLINNGRVEYPDTSSITSNLNYISIHPNNTDTLNKLIQRFNIQLEEGSVATSYEPYKSSTSTLTTSKIQLTEAMFEQGSVDEKEPVGTLYVDMKNTSESTDYYKTRIRTVGTHKVKPNTDYQLKLNSNYRSFVVCFNDGKYMSHITWNTQGTRTFTVPSNCNEIALVFCLVNSASIFVSEFLNMGVELVEALTLRGIGDVKDELNLMTGEVVERIGEIVLDGSEDWKISESTRPNHLRLYLMYPNLKHYQRVINDKFADNGDIVNRDIEGIYMSNSIDIQVEHSRLSEVSVNGFKNWLRENNIKVQAILSQKSIKTVDLTIQDQDNNPIPTIQTHPTLTHITTSSQGLIPNITIPSQLKYPTIIKPSTTYTVQLKQTTVNSEFPLTINLGGTTMAVPSTKFTITTPSELTSQDVIFTGKNNVIGEVVITEGDTTGIEYGFFEGMNDVKSPSVKTTGKNLLPNSDAIPFVSPATLEEMTRGNVFVEKGKTYTLNIHSITSATGLFRIGLLLFKDGINVTDVSCITFINGSYLHCRKDVYKRFQTSGDTSALHSISFMANDNFEIYICLVQGSNTDPNSIAKMQLEEGEQATSYEPYKGVTIEQSIDSIPLTSDMFEQGNILADNIVIGSSYQQIGRQSSTARISAKTLIKVKPNCTYTLQSDNIKMWMMAFDKNGGYIKNMELSNTITTDANTYYLGLKLQYNDDSDITPSDLDSLNLTLQEVTDEIVLRSIGDVKDTLNLTTGEYVQRIGEVVLDGKDYDNLYYTKYSMNDHETNTFTNTSVFCIWNIPNKRLGYNTSVTCSFSNCGTSSAFAPTQAKQGIYSDHTLLQNIYIDYGNNNNYTLQEFKTYLQTNPITLQYQLATPIIKKVNLTNTTKLPSYASTTHYDTIVSSNSLVPNIKIPSTIDYNVAIKPSTEYTVRCNTTNALSVDLGGSTGTLANGKVTLTTPSTLAHNSLKLGNGKVKELMVVEGNEIKDNVPFFNGMKNVQMGGIKLVNVMRNILTHNEFITISADKRTITYTDTGYYGNVNFDGSLLKPNTLYTLYFKITQNTSTINMPCGIDIDGNAISPIVGNGGTGTFKVAFTSLDKLIRESRFVFRHSTNDSVIKVQDLMLFEGDWTHLDEIPFIESEMIIEQPIIRSQGKNLFDMQNCYASPYGYRQNKGTLEQINSNEYKVIPDTTATDFDMSIGQRVNLKAGHSYTVSFKYGDTNESCFNYFKGHSSNTETINIREHANPGLPNNFTFVANEDIDYVWFGTPWNDTKVATIKDIQIEEGSTATSYEPFKQHTLSSNRVIGYEENCYYAWDTGTKASAESIASVMSDVEGLNVAYVTHASSNFSFYDKDGVYLSGSMFLSTATDFDRFGFIKVPENAKYMKMACGNTNSAPAKDYHLKATVTGELPLRSLPNGVCDTFNLVTGEYVQRVGEAVLDGDEEWTQNGNGSYGFFTTRQDSKPSSTIVCDKLKEITGWNNYSEKGIFRGTQAFGIVVTSNELTTCNVEAFKTWLSQNPITVQYELATPIVRKLGFTTKGNYKESLAVNNLSAMVMGSYGDKTYRMQGTFQSDCYNNSPIFTDGYHVRHYPTNSHGEYEYIALIGNFIYINILKDGAYNDTIGRQWLSQHPIKVGYISTAQSSTSYSNILKPIFFNNVNVQFMNNNIDIQPSLTLQARSRNSYVMDMMKANTRYTLKALANPNPFTIDGTSYSATTNGTFTSPSTLTNKLLITGLDVQEFMIIEGDVTGKNLPYFKGILSSYHDVDEIEICSVSKNLFDMNKLIYSTNNVNVTYRDVNKIIFNTSGTWAGLAYDMQLKPNTKYILSCIKNKTSIKQFYRLYNGSSYSSSGEGGGNTVTFTTNNTGKVRITYEDSIGNTTDNEVSNIMLEESPIATPYQPHKENTTIINMPMQLDTVEVIKVDRVKDMEIGGINHSTGANMDSSTVVRTKNYIPVQPNMQIIYCNNGVERATHFMYYDINKNFIGGRIYESWMTSKGTITTPDNCYFIRLYHGVTNADNLTITKKQYKPIALNELPNGVKDELIINRATSSVKLIRRVGKVVLDGSESWTQSAMWSSKYGVFFTRREDAKSNACLVLDRYKIIEHNSNGLGKEIGYYSANDNYYLGIMLSIPCNTLDELRAMLKDNPLVAYYELAEPVITEIRLKGYPFVYEDGSITLNTDIAPVTRTSYNVNQHQLINSQNETIIRHDKQISDLYDYIEIYLDEIYRMELFKMQLELSL